jgi:opacity protein-like surface antigen
MNRLLKYTAFAISTLVAATGLADSHRWATIAVGSHAGYSSQTANAGGGTGAMVYGLDVRAKFLYVFGAELQLNGGGAESAGERSMMAPKYRANAHLYIVPLNPVDIYLTLGIGGNTGGDMLDPINGDSTTYHGGIGVEYAISKKLTVALDFIMLMPGYKYINENVKDQATTILEDETNPQAVIENGGPKSNSELASQAELPELLSLDNWTTNLAVRYYF